MILTFTRAENHLFPSVLLSMLMAIFAISLGWHDYFFSSFANQVKWGLFLFSVPVLFFYKKCTLSNPFNIVFLLLSLFLVSSTYSTLVSDYLDSEGIENLIGYFVLITLAFILPFSSPNVDAHRSIFNGVLVSLFLCVLISVFLLVDSVAWANGRFRGIFQNTNALGSISALLLISSFIKFTATRSTVFIYPVIAAFVSVLLTQSRGALLGLSVCSLIYFYKNKKGKSAFWSLIVFGIVYAAGNFANTLQNVEYQQRDIVLGIDNARLLIFNKHISLFLEKPFFGQGLSGDFYGGRFASELAYTDILSFSGLFGFLFFISALAYCAYLGFKTYNSVIPEAQANFLMFIAVLVMSIGDGYISNIGNPLPIFAWLYMGSISRFRVTAQNS